MRSEVDEKQAAALLAMAGLLKELIDRAKVVGRVAAIQEIVRTVRGPGHLEARRKIASFFGYVLGHNISEFGQSPRRGDGLIGQCERCGCAIKIREYVHAEEPSVTGRALDRICVAEGESDWVQAAKQGAFPS
jgi:hypothetical protein